MNKPLRNSLLIFLIIAILFFIFRERNPFGSRNSDFSVEDGREITKVELSGGNNRIVLEKRGEDWLLNGKKETRKSSIVFILKILKEMKIKSPVSPEKFEDEINKKDIFPVRVKVSGNSGMLRSYLVYKTTSNIYGNIMKMRERSKPFIVYVPGFEGNIGPAFSLNELFWQPFTVFNLLPSEIASIHFENYADSSSSFKIINKNRNISLYNGGSELTGWDTSLVGRYLTYFTWIPFEQWAFELTQEEKKNIVEGKPMARINLTGQSGKSTVLTLWEKVSNSSGIQTKDTDRLWGKTNHNEELFILRYFDVDPILKRRSYFYPE